MSSLETQFQNAAQQIQNLSKKPSNEELLKLYSLYKQATIGDNNTIQPGFLDIKGKAKWANWNELRGMSKTNAMNDYISLAQELKKKY